MQLYFASLQSARIERRFSRRKSSTEAYRVVQLSVTKNQKPALRACGGSRAPPLALSAGF